MDESGTTQNRRSRRAKLLMAATIDHAGGTTPVTLRDLSADGALVEGEHGLAPGQEVMFRKNELAAHGRIAWVAGRRAGIAFAMSLDPETVLHHVPTPKARAEPVCKRPGLHSRLSLEDRRYAEILWGRRLPPGEG